MARRNYTVETLLENVQCEFYNKPIVSTGYLSRDNTWDINYSSQLTALIQSAGRFCEHYASDLFIDWTGIFKRLNTEDIFTDGKYEYLFGMRDSGVDGISFILSTVNNNDTGYVNAYYRRGKVRCVN